MRNIGPSLRSVGVELNGSARFQPQILHSAPSFLWYLEPVSTAVCGTSRRRVSAVLGVFREKFGRRPAAADAADFSSIVESALKDNGMPVDYLGGAEGAAAVCKTAAAEISPVCSVLGGILGQEVRPLLPAGGVSQPEAFEDCNNCLGVCVLVILSKNGLSFEEGVPAIQETRDRRRLSHSVKSFVCFADI